MNIIIIYIHTHTHIYIYIQLPANRLPLCTAALRCWVRLSVCLKYVVSVASMNIIMPLKFASHVFWRTPSALTRDTHSTLQPVLVFYMRSALKFASHVFWRTPSSLLSVTHTRLSSQCWCSICALHSSLHQSFKRDAEPSTHILCVHVLTCDIRNTYIYFSAETSVGALRVHGFHIGNPLGLPALAGPRNPFWIQEYVAGVLPLGVLLRRAHCWSRASHAQHCYALLHLPGEWFSLWHALWIVYVRKFQVASILPCTPLSSRWVVFFMSCTMNCVCAFNV